MPGRLSLFPNEISKYEFPVAESVPTHRSPSSHRPLQRNPQVSIVFESHASFANVSRGCRTNSRIEEEDEEEKEEDQKKCSEWNSSFEEDTRSGSPCSSSSLKSSLEPCGDSGVSSEQDTPPLDSRRLIVHKKTTSSMDSDNESVSSESLQDSNDSLRGEQLPPAHKIYKLPEFKKSKKSLKSGYYRLKSNNSRLPENLLKEIKAKALELRRRRQALKGEGNRRDRSCSYQRSGRMSRIQPMQSNSNQEFPTLSLVDSSNYSSTTSLYTEDDDSVASSYFNDCMKPLYECPDEAASQGFAGLSDIFAPQQESTIRSSKGTVRGVKNRVRAGIAAFTSDQRFLKIYAERERGKVVVYVTTLGIIRETFERCLRVRKILWTLLVEFEERDVFMARDTQIQLLDRLHAQTVSVPHIFLEGQYLGGVEFLERLNEIGELRRLLQPYMRPACSTTHCDLCTGFRLLPCSVCSGSKKSVHRNDFTLEFVALKCSSCDESGLVPCHQCLA